jgi:SOS response regulatory protein OraA/RecX
MKKNANEYLYNEAIKYLGKYPATKKKIEEHLHKKVMNKKTYQKVVFPDDVSKKDLISGIVDKLDELKIINEDHYLESLFHYYEKSLFSVRKIKNKLFQKGFDQKLIDEFISEKLNKNLDLELNILKKYIERKKLNNLDSLNLKKKLYQQSFSESSIYKVIKE